MEIILRQDIANLGDKNDLVNVKDGFARNYLIPKGMAIIATSSSKKELAELKKQQSHKEEKVRTEAETIAKVLEGAEFTIGVKAGESGKIFGSVNSIIIANAILEQKKLDIDRKKIILHEDHIKEIGKYKAKIKLHKDVEIEIDLDVVAE